MPLGSSSVPLKLAGMPIWTPAGSQGTPAPTGWKPKQANAEKFLVVLMPQSFSTYKKNDTKKHFKHNTNANYNDKTDSFKVTI